MRRLMSLMLLVFLSYSVFAQRNFYKLSVGAGAGLTSPYTDFAESKIAVAQNFVVDYYFTPYTSIGLEYQPGTLGDEQSFKNEYYAILGNGKIHLGELLPSSYTDTKSYNLLKGVYVGSGLGYITSHIKYLKKKTFVKEILAPINVGVNISTADVTRKNSVSFNLNLFTGLALGDNLDGEFKLKDKRYDKYTFFSAGLRYHFGIVGFYRR